MPLRDATPRPSVQQPHLGARRWRQQIPCAAGAGACSRAVSLGVSLCSCKNFILKVRPRSFSGLASPLAYESHPGLVPPTTLLCTPATQEPPPSVPRCAGQAPADPSPPPAFRHTSTLPFVIEVYLPILCRCVRDSCRRNSSQEPPSLHHASDTSSSCSPTSIASLHLLCCLHCRSSRRLSLVTSMSRRIDH